MRRRAILILSLVTLGILLTMPPAAEAQQSGKVYRVGLLWVNRQEPLMAFIQAFEEGLREHGYIVGQNLTIEHRFAEGKPERLPALAAELAQLNVDLFVVPFTATALVAQQAAPKTPIVMVFAVDPVREGVVKSLAHPGGNITGLTVNVGPEIFGKNLQLLKETLPKGARIAILFNATPHGRQLNAGHLNAVEEAGRKLGVTLVRAEVRSAEDFEPAFTVMKQKRATGVVVLDEPLFYANRQRVSDLALRSGLAASWPGRQGPETGSLMSYGVKLTALYRRAATYVDKILKGTKPSDLPIEQPATFELIVNMKTARALGLTIPPSILLRADQVIQ